MKKGINVPFRTLRALSIAIVTSLCASTGFAQDTTKISPPTIVLTSPAAAAQPRDISATLTPIRADCAANCIALPSTR